MATIGLTNEADDINEELRDCFGFKTSKDMAIFAFSYAVSHNIPQKAVYGVTTKWGTSTFDDIDFEKIIKICYPTIDEEPVKIFEILIHAGIYKIEELRKNNPDLKISDLIQNE